MLVIYNLICSVRYLLGEIVQQCDSDILPKENSLCWPDVWHAHLFGRTWPVKYKAHCTTLFWHAYFEGARIPSGLMDYGQVKHRGRLGMGERGRREVEGWRPLGHYCISNVNGRRYIKVQTIQWQKTFWVNTPGHSSFNAMTQCFVIKFSTTNIYTSVIIMDFCDCRMKMSTGKRHLSVYSRMCTVQII